MGIIDRIRGNPFEKLKKDDLTAERIRLERTEKLKIAEVERLSKQKKAAFDKGFDASEGERRTLARQMQQLDQKIKLENIGLKKLSDQVRVVDNLIFIHDNKAMLDRSGLIDLPAFQARISTWIPLICTRRAKRHSDCAFFRAV